MVYIAWGMAWIATAIPVSIGIYLTGKWQCLFFMLLPAFISIKNHKNDETKIE
jgi:hypothetical protein